MPIPDGRSVVRTPFAITVACGLLSIPGDVTQFSLGYLVALSTPLLVFGAAALMAASIEALFPRHNWLHGRLRPSTMVKELTACIGAPLIAWGRLPAALLALVLSLSEAAGSPAAFAMTVASALLCAFSDLHGAYAPSPTDGDQTDAA